MVGPAVVGASPETSSVLLGRGSLNTHARFLTLLGGARPPGADRAVVGAGDQHVVLRQQHDVVHPVRVTLEAGLQGGRVEEGSAATASDRPPTRVRMYTIGGEEEEEEKGRRRREARSNVMMR